MANMIWVCASCYYTSIGQDPCRVCGTIGKVEVEGPRYRVTREQEGWTSSLAKLIGPPEDKRSYEDYQCECHESLMRPAYYQCEECLTLSCSTCRYWTEPKECACKTSVLRSYVTKCHLCGDTRVCGCACHKSLNPFIGRCYKCTCP